MKTIWIINRFKVLNKFVEVEVRASDAVHWTDGSIIQNEIYELIYWWLSSLWGGLNV